MLPKELSNIENLKHLTDTEDISKNKDILPFVIIQEEYIVYASQIFCKQHNIENIKLGGESKLPINKFFISEISEITDLLTLDKHEQKIIKKKVAMTDGKNVNVYSKIIQWDNAKAIQLFISE
jgi:hypothetical protein